MKRTVMSSVSLLFLMNSLVQAAPAVAGSNIAESAGSGSLVGGFAGLTVLLTIMPIIIMGLFYLIAILASTAFLVIWILMLVDVIQRNEKDFGSESKDQKILWLLIILLTSYIGSVLYYFMIYRKFGRAIPK